MQRFHFIVEDATKTSKEKIYIVMAETIETAAKILKKNLGVNLISYYGIYRGLMPAKYVDVIPDYLYVSRNKCFRKYKEEDFCREFKRMEKIQNRFNLHIDEKEYADTFLQRR